jgi:hypothetical protein
MVQFQVLPVQQAPLNLPQPVVEETVEQGETVMAQVIMVTHLVEVEALEEEVIMVVQELEAR